MYTKKIIICLFTSLFIFGISSQKMLAQKARTNSTTEANTQNTSFNSQLGNYRNEKADQYIALEAEKRQVINNDLQATVVELLELFHDAKQSHWNIRGPLYFPLHEVLDSYAGLYLKYSDIFAERQLQIGNPADGRTDIIVQTANLPKFPTGFLSDKQVLEIMKERNFTISKRVRHRIENTGKAGDEVTSNKF